MVDGDQAESLVVISETSPAGYDEEWTFKDVSVYWDKNPRRLVVMDEDSVTEFPIDSVKVVQMERA